MVALEEIINQLISNPNIAMNFAIQIALGAVIGYSLRKAFAYVLAVVIALILGTFLNMWSFAQLQEVVAGELGLELTEIPALLAKIQSLLMSFYGIIGVAPILIGILIGALIAGWK